jgi:MFS family permease
VLGTIVYGATDFASYGPSAGNLSLLAVGAVLLGPFLAWEKRSVSPTIHLGLFRSRLLSRSLVASFLQSLGYLATVFLLIMYLQGIRGLSPLDASLLLVPGYVLSSGLAPLAGRWADRSGPARLATVGIGFMLVGVLLYAQIDANTSLIAIALISLVTGIGGALFWPSNNKAVMHDAPPEYYGAVSGLLRTLGNAGTIGSYTLVITVASLAVPRSLAFEVFVGGGAVIGSVSSAFLTAIHAAFYVMAAVLVVAAILSGSRLVRPAPGVETRETRTGTRSTHAADPSDPRAPRS